MKKVVFDFDLMDTVAFDGKFHIHITANIK